MKGVDMRIKYLIPFLVFVLVFSLTFVGCQNNSRVDELEKRIVDLLGELSESEDKIKELEQTPETPTTVESITETKTDEEIVEEIINNYIKAVGNENFNDQRKYVAKYALDLVNLKEDELKMVTSLEDRQFDRQPVGNIKINGNEAKAFMAFTEHLTYFDGSKYDIITEGNVLLEKVNNEWKIVDYTRKNRLVSDALFKFKDLKFNEDNIEVNVDYVFFSLFDKSVWVGISIFNRTEENLRYYSDDAILVGPDKKQGRARYYDPNLEYLLSDTIASGNIQLNWNYDSSNNFSVHIGNIIDEKGYDYLSDIKVGIDLNKAIRY